MKTTSEVGGTTSGTGGATRGVGGTTSGTGGQRKQRGLIWGFRMCRKQWPLMVAISLISGIYAVLNTYFALQSQILIDAATDRMRAEFLEACYVMSAMLAAQIVLSAARSYITTKCHVKNVTSMRQRQLNAMMHKRYDAISGWHSGELLNRIVSDTAVVSDTITSILPDLVTCLVQLIMAATILFRIDPWFTLILLVSGVVLYGFGRLISIKVKKYHKSSQEADGVARSYMQEVMGSLLVIKVFDAFDRVRQKNKMLHDRYFNIQMSRNRFSTFSSSCFTTVAILSYAFALFWCGNRLLLGTMTFGTLTAVQQLVARIRAPLTGLSNMFPRLANMEASAERMMEIINLPDEERHPMPEAFLSKGDAFQCISVDDLTFAYDFSQIDEKPVISHMNLSIDRGDFVALTGTSGIGKSTIFKILLGVYDKYYGTLKLKMTSGEYALGADTRELFAYVPQGNFLFSGTIRENITFVHPDATDEEIQHAMQVSCADDFVYGLEHQLDTVIGERGAGLSEGQVQRLAIARAVLSDAQVMLLDEATSALDEPTEARLLENLKQLKNITCMIVTHRPAALAICNKRIELVKK